MNHEPSDHPIDRAVRAHLDREAAKVDAPGMLQRVKAANAVPVRRPYRKWALGIASGVAIAASLLILFLIPNTGPDLKPLSAAEIVQMARETHTVGKDRCYDVVAEWDAAPLLQQKLPPTPRNSKLWTRGDQFWIETHGPEGNTVAWGQSKDGKIWIAPNRKRGLVYNADEVGEPITRYCDLMSLRVVTTLGELLEQYELFRRDSGLPDEPIRIEAVLRPRPGNPFPRFREVALELDPQTKVIRKAHLTRQLNGEAVGKLTFTLVDTADLPDDQYEVQGHLDADRIILDGRFPPKLPGGPPPLRPPFGPDPRAKLRDEFLKRMQERFKQ